MPPRTPLALIDGNRRFKEELTPNDRGKIEGAIAAGATYAFAAENVNCAPSTARYTVQQASKRQYGHSKPRSGRLKEWDSRFERRVLRLVRINPKTTY